MRVPFDHMQVKNKPVSRGQFPDQRDQFFIPQIAIRQLAVIFMLPNALLNLAGFLNAVLPPPEINGTVDHYSAHPAKENYFDPFLIPDFEVAKTSEYFYKPVIGNFYRLFIRIHIPENGFKTNSIEFVIQNLLRF